MGEVLKTSTRKKKIRKYRPLTPLPLRIFAFLGYLEYTLRGITLLPPIWESTKTVHMIEKIFPSQIFMLVAEAIFLTGTEHTPPSPQKNWCFSAGQAIQFFVLVYVVESILSIYPGWISMWRVHMQHMYEHHFPGAIMGIAIYWCLGDTESKNTLQIPFFWKMCQWPFSIGLMTGFCEIFFVYRTFLVRPDSWTCKMGQRILGITLVSACALSVQWAFLQYLTWSSQIELKEHHMGEIVVVPISLYLAFVLHPMYVRSHCKRAYALLQEASKKMKSVPVAQI